MVGRILLLCGVAVALALAGTAPAVAGERYVALGDSYSSGTGTRDDSLGRRCERSRYAYPRMVADQRANTDLVFVACGAATTADVLDRQVSSLDRATRWVTITIGGNDIGFSSAIRECAKPLVSCGGKIDAAQRFIRHRLPARLDRVYNEIGRISPHATVIVLGYPRLFGRRERCNAATRFSEREIRRLNATADLLRDRMRDRVAAAGPNFRFQDAIGPFTGHTVCSRDEWLNGLARPTGQSYHPNRDGHRRGYAPLVRAVMGRAAPPPAPGLPPAPPIPDRLSNDERLVAATNQFLRSADGRYRLVMQSDGNLVLYGPSGRALWASNTLGRGANHVRMQADGNLVIYDSADRPIWSSNTAGNPGAYLIVQNDGNVVIYHGARAIWATGTNGRT